MVEEKAKIQKGKGPARDRTGIVGIRIQSDNHYTTEPVVDKTMSYWLYIPVHLVRPMLIAQNTKYEVRNHNFECHFHAFLLIKKYSYTLFSDKTMIYRKKTN